MSTQLHYSTDDFSWNHDTFTFSAFASDLQFEPVKEITLRSTKTGEVRTFVQAFPERDVEGDITSWVYRNGFMRVVVYNT